HLPPLSCARTIAGPPLPGAVAEHPPPELPAPPLTPATPAAPLPLTPAAPLAPLVPAPLAPAVALTWPATAPLPATALPVPAVGAGAPLKSWKPAINWQASALVPASSEKERAASFM